ncbi:MAG TPA: hypothetical protein DCD98_09195, partial [Syntrophomonas sp.]|nr:hypothetical protein [Syntrophomonas sp.]
MHIDVAQAQGAVVGATGSIGRACSLLLSEQVANIILLGNAQHPTSSRNRLNSLFKDIFAYARERLEKGEESGLAGWLKIVTEGLSSRHDDIKAQQLWEVYNQGKLTQEWVKA